MTSRQSQSTPKSNMPPVFDTPLFYVERPLIEFEQTYRGGRLVTKRGLIASEPVVRKYDLGAEDVATFSNHEGRNRAHTAFHFHPDFPEAKRRAYMQANHEGFELARSRERQYAEETSALWEERGGQAKRWKRSAAALPHIIAGYLAQHLTEKR